MTKQEYINNLAIVSDNIAYRVYQQYYSGSSYNVVNHNDTNIYSTFDHTVTYTATTALSNYYQIKVDNNEIKVRNANYANHLIEVKKFRQMVDNLDINNPKYWVIYPNYTNKQYVVTVYDLNELAYYVENGYTRYYYRYYNENEINEIIHTNEWLPKNEGDPNVLELKEIYYLPRVIGKSYNFPM